MQAQPTLTPAEADDQADASVLALLIEDDNQRPWAVDEVLRELGDELAATDALARLQAGGVIHRLEGFVFPARAALYYHRIAL
jgi:hypothetical protein